MCVKSITWCLLVIFVVLCNNWMCFSPTHLFLSVVIPSLTLPPMLRFSAPDGVAVSSHKARYATFFDVAVLRCLLQPHWVEEGVYWALMFYLHRLREILEEEPHKQSEPPNTALPRPRSSSMVAVTPSLVNTHKTQVWLRSELYVKSHHILPFF